MTHCPKQRVTIAAVALGIGLTVLAAAPRIPVLRHAERAFTAWLAATTRSTDFEVTGSGDYEDPWTLSHDAPPSTPPEPPRYEGCFVGRISPQKGVLDLVDIWARVRARRPGARLALIGSGNARFETELRQAVEARGLREAIDLLGFLDGPEKHRIYKASRVFLHTSVHDNYGMAACEAMAAGVPAVLYDLPPLRVAYPQGCLRAPRTDRQGFADAVVRLLEDHPTWDRLSAEATAWARTQDWDRKAAEVLQFLRDGVDRRCGGGHAP